MKKLIFILFFVLILSNLVYALDIKDYMPTNPNDLFLFPAVVIRDDGSAKTFILERQQDGTLDISNVDIKFGNIPDQEDKQKLFDNYEVRGEDKNILFKWFTKLFV